MAWVLAFMRWRRELDVKRFSQAAGEQSNLFQLITGMQEIKLNNCETKMRWKWERIQVKLFKIGIKGLDVYKRQMYYMHKIYCLSQIGMCTLIFSWYLHI